MAQITPTFNYVGTPRNHPDSLCVMPNLCPEPVLPCANFDNFVEEQADPPPWWLPSGVRLADCIAAYIPMGSTDLPDSYVNKAHPGVTVITIPTDTWTPDPAIPPSFDTSLGWVLDDPATNNYLQFMDSGVPIDSLRGKTIIVFCKPATGNSFSGTSTQVVDCELRYPGNYGETTYIEWSVNDLYFANKDYYVRVLAPSGDGGMYGIAGDYAYLNGSYILRDLFIAPGLQPSPLADVNLTIAGVAIYDVDGSNVAVSRGRWGNFQGSIQAVLMYNIALIQAQLDELRANAIAAGIL